MHTSLRHHLYIGLMMLVALVLIGLSLPRRQGFSLESPKVGSLWLGQTLTSPAPIAIELDQATREHVIDSVTNEYVHYYTHNVQHDRQQLETLRQALDNQADSWPVGVRQMLLREVEAAMTTGIVDNDFRQSVLRGELTEVRLLDGSTNNTTQRTSTAAMRKEREVYAHIDSMLQVANARPLADSVDLQLFIKPNIVYSIAEDSQWLNSEIEHALGKVDNNQMLSVGDTIVRSGDPITDNVKARIDSYIRYENERESARHASASARTAGEVILVALLLIALAVFMATMRPQYYADLRRMLFIVAVLTLFSVVVLLAVRFRLAGFYVMPFAIVAVMVTTFYDTRTAFYVHMTTMLVCSLVAPHQAGFIIMQFLAGGIAINVVRGMTRRSQLVQCAALIFLCYCICTVAMYLIANSTWPGGGWKSPLYLVRDIGWFRFLHYALSCVLLALAYFVIVIVERIFGFTSTMKLVELSELNNPLLRELSEKCPGTFQHSMQVANIAGEAALQLGANAQLVRVGALYHDIGKIDNPAFFTENQLGVNPHDALPPQQSARIIISHVTDGLRHAEQAALPRVVRDFISQHHGRSTVKYFLAKARQAAPEGTTVDPAPYTYPGPNPQTREVALLMMADACEAATKSLSDHSQEAIAAMVERIIEGQMADGLFREAPVSFSDIERVKKIFTARLSSFYHTRVSYQPVESPTDASAKLS